MAPTIIWWRAPTILWALLFYGLAEGDGSSGPCALRTHPGHWHRGGWDRWGWLRL